MEQMKVFKTLKAYADGRLSRRSVVHRLKDISPIALLKGEKLLLKNGYSIQDLKGLSRLYQDLIQDDYKAHLSEMDQDHPIRILMMEHLMITKLLDELEVIENKLVDGGSINRDKVDKIINNIEEIEKHHLREENVIFPRLEKRGFRERVEILSIEHSNFINHELKLIEALDNIRENKNRVLNEIDYLLSFLRFHAFMENAILYPVALNNIDDWEEVKEEMEIIGYSSFVSMNGNAVEKDEMLNNDKILKGMFDKELISKEDDWKIGGKKMPKKRYKVKKVDVSGETCPVPLVETRKAVRKASPGDLIEIVGTHPASKKEIPMAVDSLGLELVSVEGTNENWRIRIKIPEEEGDD